MTKEILIQLIPLFMNGIKNHFIENPVNSSEMETGLTITARKYNLISQDEKIKGTDIRKITNYLCNNNIPIASNNKGYWYARNMSEYQPAIDQISGRAFKLLRRRKNMFCATFNDSRQSEIISYIINNKNIDLQLFEN